jgi:2-oxoglutarate ferredoxin oxidoreductase subunit beta
MANIPQKVIHRYLRRHKKFPHVWCSGCSNGIVLGSLIRAIAELELEKDDVTLVSGIGCSSRLPVYADFNTCHSLHGRPLPFATGIKLFKPEQNVIIITGDGDATAIGGNHFIHTCRRNIDVTILVLNNNIYGMTGGQSSPTTPLDGISATTPHGNIDPVFDICKLAIGAGATFVARATAFHTLETSKIIRDAIAHKGTSVIEIMSTCPVSFGKMNKRGNAATMLKWLKDNSISLAEAEKLEADKKEGKIIRGILHKEIQPEYCDRYQALCESLQKKEEAKK